MSEQNGGGESERTYHVDLMTRVEGEGRFFVHVKDGAVLDARLEIFEAPRFFEGFVRGREPDEVVDIVARICGICPVAYQVSASRAFEAAFGVALPEPVRALRRLLYCGEWIESHALHVFMLHAPDFLGYASAVEMAADHKGLVEQGLRIKKAGNALIEALGGRATHPVSPRVGGFWKAPSKETLRALAGDLARALEETEEATRFVATLDAPDFTPDYVYVALEDGARYPIEAGDRIVVSGREPVDVARWDEVMEEHHVPHSNALQARLKDGTPYLCGPMARLHHHAEKLHPRAAELMREVGLGRSEGNPHRSIVVRCVETVHALAEALDIVAGYAEPEAPAARWEAKAAVGCGASEAPRGLLWHRYAVGADGWVADARIVPPTSQNQARIEDDLRGMAPGLAEMEHGAATELCEQLIRAYDPCISCATHFLDLRIERG
ncbi:MAG TPA: Ni/Fe hydrogenase subunit alpha [Polyangiaceae bacterium LLY-WYZ-15_(1-7)]|nr:Ni/Fe hydrogenase subunit alpha [Polyangiaceae bacterium LLY-WYZ-15_(1-7)]HJL05373.1 Ni/Fe hydrogenase subunit alpha [Polyangiaceae bacterium LLY-WYZ-15_(1-7)]HJL07252.1 Ni/Fe hydrogenase subunit alpha [Polyangiaceae bacterium LLY-WYZ-15_(1-7)]HJL25466.1 Ni/Fe hydrogenase subunit alpha [Polyangiaceae bacterium LLY-WYZ-15_(1-7)]HJL29971.1 Ni/Fe hydrogenase subunit alpha [Polyangiaceae bacterium LLY-WYZ-15_(1-7)]